MVGTGRTVCDDCKIAKKKEWSKKTYKKRIDKKRELDWYTLVKCSVCWRWRWYRPWAKNRKICSKCING